ncbi:Reverse transcriptase (RNA-dependent DNA polymerase) [Popillia japonica]|uniref:RNA-directed DNA polymerase n=1 Tax=Popillia japonica TaxID=7064 RepID=A0AAW1KI55_POPJA
MEEVKHRTQGQNESIGLYLSVMSNLFARFTHKISDAKQLKILMKNILPFYQTQLGLVEITSIPQLLKLGVIQKSNSAWSSPILMVPKKDGSLRFCVDFRKINQVIEKDAYPLPYISNTLDKLRNAQYLSSLDIKSAYWQIPLHPDSQPYTAFTTLKNHLVAAPVLSCPDFSKTFTIQCDASDYGIGAALTQEFDDGEKVICYLSQSLSRQQRKFSTTEKECLAVLWAIEKLRPYVEGSHFKVITDHYSLLWLRKLQNPSGRLARWSVRLQQYDFEIIHRKGKEHLVPDALSRAVPVVETVAIIPETPSTDKWYNKLLESIQRHPIRYPKFRIEDQLLYKAVDTKNEYGFPEQQGKWKIVVPKDKRIEILHQHHDIPTSGHLGVYKTFHRLATKYYWPKMKSDVASYIRKCQACIKSKPEQRTKAGEMGGHSQISAPWEVISIDLVGPLPRSSKGYNHILVVVDLFSKFSLCFPLRKATASKVVEHLENDVFLLFGVPRKIVSDK